MTRQQAAALIEQGRLRLGKVDQSVTGKSRAGQVMEQHPSPGTRVRTGTAEILCPNRYRLPALLFPAGQQSA